MAWTLYTSADTSAPVLTGVAGSLVTLLDAVLVNGYGSKPAAGWSKAYSGTNKAAYRNGSGANARKYVRVNDAAAGSGGAKEALIRGFDSMSDVDTGTTPFPSAAQSALTESGLIIRKSNTADSTARAWVAAADDRTLILFVATVDTSGFWCVTYAGEFFSYLPGDAHCFALLGRWWENSSNRSAEGMPRIFGAGSPGLSGSGFPTSTGANGHFIAGSHLGVASSVNSYLAAGNGLHYGQNVSSSAANATDNIGGHLAAPNAADGGLHACPLLVMSYSGSVHQLHGHLRGVIGIACAASAFNDGDTISGSGELAARSWRVMRSVSVNANAASTAFYITGNLYLETSTPEHA